MFELFMTLRPKVGVGGSRAKTFTPCLAIHVQRIRWQLKKSLAVNWYGRVDSQFSIETLGRE